MVAKVNDKKKKSAVKISMLGHRKIAWVSAFFLLVFVLSGLTHPLLTWTGPQAVKMMPPSLRVKMDDIHIVSSIVEKYSINEASVIKIVSSQSGPMLQVTEDPFLPRRYFDISTLQERVDYEEKHAIWLARYYTGLNTAPIKSVNFQTEFDYAYPGVNRLLPVYNIEFETSDNRHAYVYTEINALSSLGNRWRSALQFVFKNLHTLDWLKSLPNLRVVMLLIMCAILLVMTVFGIVLLWRLKRRKNMNTISRIHRALAYVIVAPFVFFILSGVFHLLYKVYSPRSQAVELSPLSQLERLHQMTSYHDEMGLSSKTFNHISLISTADNRLLFRFSEAKPADDKQLGREARFKGVSVENNVYYLPVSSSQDGIAIDDKAMAVDVLRKYKINDDIKQIAKVTRFGSGYDFRNKRLPVWRIETVKQKVYFVDVVTASIVDEVMSFKKIEQFVFTYAHKWNFLKPVLGRKGRDIMLVFILFALSSLGVLGMLMRFRRK